MKKIAALMIAAGLLLGSTVSVSAKNMTYRELYADALSDAASRHNRMLSTGELDDIYNTISYALSDITGDGVKELIICQVTNKHSQEYWVYGISGASSFYMGEFDGDTHTMYGYSNGILYEEYYKGSYSLGLAEWDGTTFSNSILVSGTYDREGNPPAVSDLSSYYDPDRLLDMIPDFKALDVDSDADSGSSSSDIYDLTNYVYRTVKIPGNSGALVFQTEPKGSFLSDHQFWSGDLIYVYPDWRQDGYAIAYQDGVYGYVDAGYIDWDSNGSGQDNRLDLSHFGYRRVNTRSRGALIFQTQPGGSFLTEYQFQDGDMIYANLDWRQDGYTIAYQDGVYGYVDASYIEW